MQNAKDMRAYNTRSTLPWDTPLWATLLWATVVWATLLFTSFDEFCHFRKGHFHIFHLNCLRQGHLITMNVLLQSEVPTFYLAGSSVPGVWCGLMETIANLLLIEYFQYHWHPNKSNLGKLPERFLSPPRLYDSIQRCRLPPMPTTCSLQKKCWHVLLHKCSKGFVSGNPH